MPWTPLNLSAAPDVVATVKKNQVSLLLSGGAVRRLGWSEAEPNIAAALGDGDDSGWLRLRLDDDEGVTPQELDGKLLLIFPRSVLPDLQDCKASPLAWRAAEGAIEVRLPTVAARAKPAVRPRLAVNNAAAKPTAEEVIDEAAGVTAISPPDLYAGLHRTAWENGVELMFLSNGNVLVNGKERDIDDIESIVRDAVERRNTARSRAG